MVRHTRKQLRADVPAKASLTIPHCEFEITSPSVRHCGNIRFIVEDVEHEEDMQVMLREFVQDLARVGFEEDESFKDTRKAKSHAGKDAASVA